MRGARGLPVAVGRLAAVSGALMVAACATSQGGPVSVPAERPAPADDTPTSAVGEPAASAESVAEPTREARSAAASAVARVSLEIDPASVRAGDTAAIRAIALDEDGRVIEGVGFQIRAPRRMVEVRDDETLIALREGSVSISAVATLDGAAMPGAPHAVTNLTILPAPLVRLEIAAPERLYTGSSAAARAAGSTAHGPREIPPAVRWSSSDPAVLRVSEHGTLRAVSPGVARVEASADGVASAATVRVLPSPVRRFELRPPAAVVLVGEVVHMSASALDETGAEVDDAAVTWSIAGPGAGVAGSAEIGAEGAFVANTPGTYWIFASTGDHAALAEVHARPRPPRRGVTVLGHAALPAGAGATTDLRVFEGIDGRDYAYAGTLAAATMYAWDVTTRASPVLRDSVKLDGRRINDVKVNDDATIAIVTSEGASNRRNGITLLDILDPAHPKPITHFTENLTGGVHNVWIEDDLVYAVHNGTRDLHIVDISDPAEPRHVGRWGVESDGRVLHDVMVKDGFAYLSYWNDGLVILDVGAGIAAGTPTEPRFVSRHVYSYPLEGEVYGNTHHAIRYRNWVFVADEIFDCAACVNGPRGYVHVIDVADIENPVEVAFYRVPEAGAHNMWVEDDRLYVAYYQAGVRIVDVSGELRGDLWRQGRELGWYMTEAAHAEVPNAAMAWGPQPFKGALFVSDLNSGLWILRLEGESGGLVP